MAFRFYKMPSSFGGCHCVVLSGRSHADSYVLSFKLGSSFHSFPRLKCLLREVESISCGKYHLTPMLDTTRSFCQYFCSRWTKQQNFVVDIN